MLEIASPRRANAWGGIGSSGCEPSRVSWFRARRVHVRGVDRPQIWPVERRPGLPRPGVVGQDSMKPMKLRSSLRRTAMSSKEFVPQNNWTKAIRFQKKTAANLLSSQIRRPTGRENSCWYGKKGLAKAQNSCSGAPNPRSGALELLLFCLRLKGLGEERLSNFFGLLPCWIPGSSNSSSLRTSIVGHLWRVFAVGSKANSEKCHSLLKNTCTVW